MDDRFYNYYPDECHLIICVYFLNLIWQASVETVKIITPLKSLAIQYISATVCQLHTLSCYNANSRHPKRIVLVLILPLHTFLVEMVQVYQCSHILQHVTSK